MSKSNGNVIKKHTKNHSFTVVDNSIFMNKGLSLKAKGLLTMLLSLPDNWQFSERGLTALSTDGRDSIRSGLKELEEFGYLVREQERGENGQFKTIYNIHEKPVLEKPSRKNRVGKTESDNPTAYKELNNKILNNKELNNKVYEHSTAFAAFWKAYPKKRNKGQAEKAFKKMVKDEATLKSILEDLEKRKQFPDWIKQDGKFIPYPSTYLNAKGWLDEYEIDSEFKEAIKPNNTKYVAPQPIYRKESIDDPEKLERLRKEAKELLKKGVNDGRNNS